MIFQLFKPVLFFFLRNDRTSFLTSVDSCSVERYICIAFVIIWMHNMLFTWKKKLSIVWKKMFSYALVLAKKKKKKMLKLPSVWFMFNPAVELTSLTRLDKMNNPAFWVKWQNPALQTNPVCALSLCYPAVALKLGYFLTQQFFECVFGWNCCLGTRLVQYVETVSLFSLPCLMHIKINELTEW